MESQCDRLRETNDNLKRQTVSDAETVKKLQKEKIAELEVLEEVKASHDAQMERRSIELNGKLLLSAKTLEQTKKLVEELQMKNKKLNAATNAANKTVDAVKGDIDKERTLNEEKTCALLNELDAERRLHRSSKEAAQSFETQVEVQIARLHEDQAAAEGALKDEQAVATGALKDEQAAVKCELAEQAAAFSVLQGEKDNIARLLEESGRRLQDHEYRLAESGKKREENERQLAELRGGNEELESTAMHRRNELEEARAKVNATLVKMDECQVEVAEKTKMEAKGPCLACRKKDERIRNLEKEIEDMRIDYEKRLKCRPGSEMESLEHEIMDLERENQELVSKLQKATRMHSMTQVLLAKTQAFED